MVGGEAVCSVKTRLLAIANYASDVRVVRDPRPLVRCLAMS
jgi:hypothetical protein